jgi:hypothetical protein
VDFPFEQARPVLSLTVDPLSGQPIRVSPGAGGYTVDDTVMARTVGELEVLGDTVGAAADQLAHGGGDLGPSGVGAAVAELATEWRDGLTGMRDRIQHMADAVRTAGAGYARTEQAAADSFRTTYGM